MALNFFNARFRRFQWFLIFPILCVSLSLRETFFCLHDAALRAASKLLPSLLLTSPLGNPVHPVNPVSDFLPRETFDSRRRGRRRYIHRPFNAAKRFQWSSMFPPAGGCPRSTTFHFSLFVFNCPTALAPHPNFLLLPSLLLTFSLPQTRGWKPHPPKSRPSCKSSRKTLCGSASPRETFFVFFAA